MKTDKNRDSWLDGALEKAIGSERKKADFEGFKTKHNQAIEKLISRAGRDTAVSPQNVWRIILKSRIAKFAAAAVIIIAICFFFTRQGRNREIKPQQITQTANSPAEMLTMASLNLAYRHGGMEAAEMQSQKAFKMIGVVKSNIKQLQEELINNNGI